MPNEVRFCDKLITFFKSWPIGVTGGFLMAFLTKVLTDSNITALLLGVTVFFGVIGIFSNNITGWKKWVAFAILIIFFVVGILVWNAKYRLNSSRPIQVAEEKPSSMAILIQSSIPFIPMHTLTMTSIDADRKKSELTVILKNYGKMDISSDMAVWIGIFPYFGSYTSDHIQWIKSDSKQDIPAGMRGEFTIKRTIEPHMAVVVAIEGKEFPNGLLLDEAGILYTWDYWQYKGWLPWQPYKTSVTQTPKMEMTLDKFSRCAHKHSVDRNYLPCFKE